MKSWEDMIRRRFANHADPGKPGENDALWKAIEGSLPTPVAASTSVTAWGSRATRWGIAAAIGTVALAVWLWPGTDASVNEADLAKVPSATVEQPSQDSEPPAHIEAKDTGTLEVAPEFEGSSSASEGANLALENQEIQVEVTMVPVVGSGGVEVQERESTASLGGAIGEDKPKALSNQVVSEGDGVAGEIAMRDADEGLPVEVEVSDVKSEWVRTASMLSPLMAEGLQSAMKAGPFLLPMPAVLEPQVPMAVRVHGGLTFSHFRFNDDRPADLSGYFHTDFSAGGGVALDVQRWGHAFSIGVAWYDYVHRLEYLEITVQEHIEPEGVQSIEINALTGDTVAVNLGEVLGTAEQHRFIRSYNRFNAVVIPLEWRQERSRGRWSAGLGLGGQLLVRSGGHGHNVDRDGLIEAYSDADLPKARLNWMPTARAYFGFQMVPEWRLDVSMGAGIQRFRSRRINEVGLVDAPQWDGRLSTGQLQVGLTRFFASRPKTVPEYN